MVNVAFEMKGAKKIPPSPLAERAGVRHCFILKINPFI
jgi:hypothetical protein